MADRPGSLLTSQDRNPASGSEPGRSANFERILSLTDRWRNAVYSLPGSSWLLHLAHILEIAVSPTPLGFFFSFLCSLLQSFQRFIYLGIRSFRDWRGWVTITIDYFERIETGRSLSRHEARCLARDVEVYYLTTFLPGPRGESHPTPDL